MIQHKACLRVLIPSSIPLNVEAILQGLPIMIVMIYVQIEPDAGDELVFEMLDDMPVHRPTHVHRSGLRIDDLRSQVTCTCAATKKGHQPQ